MKNIVMAYCDQLVKRSIRVNVYDRNMETHEKFVFLPNQSAKNYRVNLLKNRKVVQKELSLDKIEELLTNKCKYQMVTIYSKEEKKEIYSIIGKVSKKNGICSPFIELEDCVMYFPQLRYSDLDLLRYLCEQRKIKRYKLLMVSGC